MARTFTQERKPQAAASRKAVKVDKEVLALLAYVKAGLSVEDARKALELATMLQDERKARRAETVASFPLVENELAKALADAWEALEAPRMEAAQALNVPFMLASTWASATHAYRRSEKLGKPELRMRKESLDDLRSILAI